MEALMNKVFTFSLLGVLAGALLSTDPLAAQTAQHEVSVAIGASQFDASGTGTVPMAAIRLASPIIGRWMLADASFSYASLDEQFSTVNTRVGVLEGQIQAQLPVAHFRPYIGLGGGWLHYFNNAVGRRTTTATVSGAVGLRVPVASRTLLRGELRLRGWGSGSGSNFTNSAAEFTAGVGYAF
jgi:hypothetical protein